MFTAALRRVPAGPDPVVPRLLHRICRVRAGPEAGLGGSGS
jgi:hypothetical protein